MFSLKLGEEIVGTIALEKVRGKSNTAAATLVAIKEEYQGQGLGKLLLSETKKWAIHNAINTIVVNAAPEAKAFYNKSGFVEKLWNDAAPLTNVEIVNDTSIEMYCSLS